MPSRAMPIQANIMITAATKFFGLLVKSLAFTRASCIASGGIILIANVIASGINITSSK